MAMKVASPGTEVQRRTDGTVGDAISKAGYQPGEEIFIGLDAAASEFCSDGEYVFDQSDGSRRSAEEIASMWSDWTAKYPLISLEDGFSEVESHRLEDWHSTLEQPTATGRRRPLCDQSEDLPSGNF